MRQLTGQGLQVILLHNRRVNISTSNPCIWRTKGYAPCKILLVIPPLLSSPCQGIQACSAICLTIEYLQWDVIQAWIEQIDQGTGG